MFRLAVTIDDWAVSQHVTRTGIIAGKLGHHILLKFIVSFES